MTILIIFFAIAVIIIVLAQLKKDNENKKLGIGDLLNGEKKQGEYWSKKPLSEIEQKAYWLLKKTIGDEKVIMPQVAFSSFIRTKGDREAKGIMWNQMRQKVADFVICNKDFSIHCIIEIDDKTHDAEKDKSRDYAVSKAGIKTYRFRAIDLPTEEELRKAIL